MAPKNSASSACEEGITTLVEKSLKRGVFPGIEILCGRWDQITFHRSYGKINQQPESPALKNGSLFDLASLTKPLSTATAIVHLAEHNKLALDEPASRIIEEFQGTEKSELTISQLLTHSAGFSDWLALYEPSFDRTNAWEKLVSTPLAYSPGFSVVYSCLGYIVLAEIVRRVSGMSLADYSHSTLFEPLGLTSLTYHPDTKREDIVPTAFCSLRNKQLRGVVHDENAFAFGGEGGNAGLFGSASDIYAVCLMLLSSGRLNGKQIFSEKAVQGFLENQNQPYLPARTYGWDVNDGSETEMSCGKEMPIGSVGHLGFTGTSIWMDPASGIIIILLSNRVNLSREENIPLMRVFRPEMHTLLLTTVLT